MCVEASLSAAVKGLDLKYIAVCGETLTCNSHRVRKMGNIGRIGPK